jgi:hypothetical protein
VRAYVQRGARRSRNALHASAMRVAPPDSQRRAAEARQHSGAKVVLRRARPLATDVTRTR